MNTRIPRSVTTATIALAAFLTSTSASAQGRSLEIASFDATISVEEDGWIEVREEIQARFTGSWNGIFRTIPVSYTTPQGFSYGLFLEDLRVMGPGGESLEYTTSRERHYLKLKIRVPGASDATREVVIAYRIPNALKFWDEYQELYWNVTGDEWEVPIRHASAMILLPPGLEGLRTASWTGGYGSTENGATVEETEEGFFFETRRSLNFREGFTLAVAWNPGVVSRPGVLARIWFFLRGNWPFFFPILSFAFMAWLWHTRGRDPARLSIAPQYEPLAGMTPSEVGTLLDNSPDMRDITAAIVDLAVRGYLRIEEVEVTGLKRFFGKDDWRFLPRTTGGPWSGLKAHERTLLEGLFGSEGAPSPTRLSDLEHKFYRHLPVIQSRIFEALLAARYYHHRPDKVRQGYIGAGVVVAALGMAVGQFADLAGVAPLTPILAAILTAVPVFAFGWIMPARTIRGARALEHTLGFQEFLDRVESDRFERMVKSPEMFEKFLPFAMALGAERRWAEAFADIYTEPPSWYVGRWDGSFHSTRFVHAMGSMTSSASTRMASQPRSSGGSGFGGGGGGFSGGGFGGGGGGGW
ncbi:MAG: DUF2207 domain-containing protein [Gemmatimonadota bacterium]|nr:DUF2207 domain-containing protein [Gemmatimonadota bacterium]MDH5760055.1 DUF2207 domain-containing protein [Gemmatimonadota bacterium]